LHTHISWDDGGHTTQSRCASGTIAWRSDRRLVDMAVAVSIDDQQPWM